MLDFIRNKNAIRNRNVRIKGEWKTELIYRVISIITA
jgi:hypothetical protein